MEQQDIAVKAIQEFVDSMIGARESGFEETSNLSLADIHSYSRFYIKQHYGVESATLAEKWGAEVAELCKLDGDAALNAALLAQNEKLKAFLKDHALPAFALAKIDYPESSMAVVSETDCLALISEPQAASLAAHDADLLNGIADEWQAKLDKGEIWKPIDVLRRQANRLNGQADSACQQSRQERPQCNHGSILYGNRCLSCEREKVAEQGGEV